MVQPWPCFSTMMSFHELFYIAKIEKPSQFVVNVQLL